MHQISQRDNIGGTKYKKEKWVVKFDDVDQIDFVETFFQSGTKERNLSQEMEQIYFKEIS